CLFASAWVYTMCPPDGATPRLTTTAAPPAPREARTMRRTATRTATPAGSPPCRAPGTGPALPSTLLRQASARADDPALPRWLLRLLDDEGRGPAPAGGAAGGRPCRGGR